MDILDIVNLVLTIVMGIGTTPSKMLVLRLFTSRTVWVTSLVTQRL
jgi:hypothetical protein